jgi:hypothetical protein
MLPETLLIEFATAALPESDSDAADPEELGGVLEGA